MNRLNTIFFGSFHSNIRSDMFYKIGLFKNFGKLTRKRLCRSFFLIKLYTIKPATLLKRDFSSDVLLWILRNCFKHFFYRTPPVSVSHFNSTFLTLSLRRTYIYIFEALLGLSHFHFLVELGTNPFDSTLNVASNKLYFWHRFLYSETSTSTAKLPACF